MLGQHQVLPDAGRKNIIVPRPGSNSPVKKLLLIYKVGVFWWEKNSQLNITMIPNQIDYPNRIALRVDKKTGAVCWRLSFGPNLQKIS